MLVVITHVEQLNSVLEQIPPELYQKTILLIEDMYNTKEQSERIALRARIKKMGIHRFGNSNVLTKYDFGNFIARAFMDLGC